MRNAARIVGLVVLAPFFAEYLIGSISISRLHLLPFLIPMYGGAALLIRETGRRTGTGWPSILLLAGAFGVFQAGIVDGSLFNPDYAGLDLRGAEVPGLHFSAVFGLAFVMNHVMLSIGAPIALVEALSQDTAPWLGRVGLAVTGLCYLAGSALIGWDNWTQEAFYPSPVQLAAAGAVVVTLIVVAVRPAAPARPAAATAAPPPSPRAVGGLVALTSGLYFFVPADVAGLVLGIALITGTAVVVTRWSHRPGWDGRHRVALAAGALFTAAWGAFVVGSFTGQTDALTRSGNVVFALATAGLVFASARSVPSPAQPRAA